MRITQRMMTSQVQGELGKIVNRLQETNSQIASGKRLRRPSDDPAATANALAFRHAQGEMDQFIRNADDALSQLNASDASLEGLDNLISRAREIAIAQANDTSDSQMRESAAAEVKNILSQMLDFANASFNERYLFAGSATTTAPFESQEEGFIYKGNSDELPREIGPNQMVAANVILSDKMVNILNNVKAFEKSLVENDVEGIRNQIDLLGDGLDQVNQARTDAGARASRIEMSKDFLLNQKTQIASLLSDVEDVDIAFVMTRFIEEQNSYRMALEVAAKIVQPTLIDFLN